MAMTVGVDRELGAPWTAAPLDGDVDWRRLVLFVGTLSASLSFSAGLSPAVGPWSDDEVDALLHTMYPERYLVFFYCDTVAVGASASLLMVLLLILPWDPASSYQRISNQRIKLLALRVTLILGLLCRVSAYVAVSSLSFVTSIYVVALAAAMILYIAIQITMLLCKSLEIPLSRVKRSPQNRPRLIPTKKKKHLLKVEQKKRKHQQKNIMSGQDSGDAYQILKRSRMHMLLLGTLVASITYQAGLNPLGGFWHGEATGTKYQYASGDDPILLLHDKTRYLVFLCCNASAFLVSLAIVVMLLLSSVFSTLGIKYYRTLHVAVSVDLFCLIGAYVAVTLDWFCLIGAYVVGGIRQLLDPVYFNQLVVLVSINLAIYFIAFPLQMLLGWKILWRALREKMEQCLPDWLKKLFGLSTNGQEEEEEGDDDDEKEEVEEEAVAMELKLEKWRKLLLLIATLVAILAYNASTSPRPDYLVNYRHLAFSYCNGIVFIASLSIIAMLANRTLPAERGVRRDAILACVIIDVIGLMGVFAARGYWKISTIDVLVFALAVLLYIVFHVESPAVFVGPDPLQDEGIQHDYEVGITGGTNQEPLGVEIASTILEGALTLSVAVPVISIVDIPVRLLGGFMIASIGVGLWRRSFARLHRALASALQRRQGTMPSTGSSSSSPEHGMWKLIHTLCSGTWMWIIFLVMWVPSLRPNLKLKFKMSKIFAVLSELVDGTPTPDTTTGTAASTTTTATVVTPCTATSTGVGTLIMTAASGGTPITADASGTPTMASASGGTPIMADVLGAPITAYALGTSMGREVQPLLELRPRRNRRVNSRLIGPDWVN